MTGSTKWLAAFFAITIPATAFAQVSDATYCRRLSARYEAFVDNMQGHSNDRASLAGDVALQQCREGNYAAGIPVLERELINNKISLPSHS
ncbi:MAG: hypothetical protein JOY64_32060 [Alphaproteobacteria bacterium]|nr:hypothetical protein [Alphaproteobacteria bacterium]MBV8412295.1 hypothetical protein [Alphaproteobacteria bacterium]